MAEFKAQILGIVLVLGVFSVLATAFSSLAQNTMDNVSNQVSEVLTSN